jgi:uncharacterized protein YbjT (DUF2867 family)
MRSVLVLGGTGKTGSELSSALSSRSDVQVRIASRHPAASNLERIQTIRFDWEDEATWSPAVAGVEAIYLVKPKTADPAATVTSFLTHCRGIGRIVLLSEIAAEKQDASADELRVEKVIESGDCEWAILRPNWFMQNFAVPTFFGDAIRNQHAVTLPSAGQPISFIDTRDIASCAAVALLENGQQGKHYTLTGPQALTVADALEQIGAVARYDVSHLDPPLNEYLAKSEKAGASAGIVAYYHRVYSNIANGFDSVVTGDVERLTGRKPRSFADFVREYQSSWT